MKKCTKYHWRVGEPPVGAYRSFQVRAWPGADYASGAPAARVYCEDEYKPTAARAGTHAPLTLQVADHSVTPWRWRKVKGTFKTLADAKATFEQLLNELPDFAPKEKP